MSLGIYFTAMRYTEVGDFHVTHNLIPMARTAGIYEVLWCPKESGFETAGEMIEPLEKGYKELFENPKKYTELEPNNNWGNYQEFLYFVYDLIGFCYANEDATVEVHK